MTRFADSRSSATYSKFEKKICFAPKQASTPLSFNKLSTPEGKEKTNRITLYRKRSL